VRGTTLLESRIFSRARTGGDFEGIPCWESDGAHTSGGYSTYARDGKVRYAHRDVYTELRSEIPAGLELDHLCRNRGCFNPWHLEPVTHAENMRRAGQARQALPLFPCGHDRASNTRKGRNDCAECHRQRERKRRK
jgi:hypothetical protein